MIPIFFDMYISLDGVWSILSIYEFDCIAGNDRLHIMVLVPLRMTARFLSTH